MDNSFEADARQIFIASEDLNSNLNQYNRRINDLYEVVGKLSNTWTGFDSEESIKAINRYRPTTEELSKTIQQSATILYELSKNLDEVTESILESANNLLKRSN